MRYWCFGLPTRSNWSIVISRNLPWLLGLEMLFVVKTYVVNFFTVTSGKQIQDKDRRRVWQSYNTMEGSAQNIIQDLLNVDNLNNVTCYAESIVIFLGVVKIKIKFSQLY